MRRTLVQLHLQAEHRQRHANALLLGKKRGLPRLREGCSCVVRSCFKQQLVQFSTQRKPMEPPLEALWPSMGACDILQMRVTSKEVNDTKKYGPCGELFFFSRWKQFSPRHVSTECPFSFVRPKDLRPSACKDPLAAKTRSSSAQQKCRDEKSTAPCKWWLCGSARGVRVGRKTC